jgi:hypothetical protein
MANPWDIMPVEPKGDDDPNAIWCAVGKALSHWELLELHLSLLFGQVIRSSTDAAKAAFGAIASFEGRIRVVQTAVMVAGSQ